MRNKKVILCVALLLAFACTTPHKQQATIENIAFASDTLHIGSTKAKTTQQGRFTFTNVGLDSIRILAVNGSCGCISFNFTEGKIAQKSAGQIEFSITSPETFGKFSEILVAKFDKTPFLKTLHILGEVEAKAK
jgi:hypothetical protein